jgi:uncharacterized protein (TIGR00730 family)
VYAEAARALGAVLAQRGHSLVYGGGNVGLMGILADSVLAAGGRVTGVIPDFLLQREVGHNALTVLEVVATMHERKRRMADLADAFIALPGGWGTLDELAEILTWRQLHLTHQPVGILNVQGFFDPLLSCFQQMAAAGFLSAANLKIISVATTPEELVQQVLPA